MSRKPRTIKAPILDITKATALFTKMTKLVCDELESAGADPTILYATRKTGLFPTDDNWHLLTPTQKRQWEEALQEYRQLPVPRKRLNPKGKMTQE